MATIANLVVKLNLDDNSFQRQLQSTRDKLDKWGSNFRSWGTKLTAGVTTPIVGAGLAFVNWASDLEQAFGKSEAVFGDQANAVQQWSESTAKSYGFAQSESLAMASTYGSLFKVMGMSNEVAADYSMQLIGLSADMAAFNDVSNERASQALMAGLSGEYMSLRSMGVFLNEAQVSQEALNIAMADGREEITDADKVQARYNLIMKQTAQQHGQAAREMDGWASSMARARAMAKNLGADIGRKLMPYALKLLDSVERLVDWFSNLSDRTQFIIIAIAAFAAALGPVLLVIGMLLPGLSALLAVIGFLISPIGLVVVAVAALAAGLIYAYTHFESFREIVNMTAQAIGKVLGPAFGVLGDAVRAAIGEITEIMDLLGKVFGKPHKTTATMTTVLDGDAAVHEVIYDENGIRRDMVMTIAEDGTKETFGEIIESYVDPENERIAHIKIQPEGDGEAFWTTIDLDTGKIESVDIEVRAAGAEQAAAAIQKAVWWALILQKIDPYLALQRGSNAAANWLNEMGAKTQEVIAKFGLLAGEVATAVGNTALTLVAKGGAIILGFWDGASQRWETARTWFVNLGIMAFNAVGDLASTLKSRGAEIILGFWDGATQRWEAARTWFINLGTMAFNAVGNLSKKLMERGRQILTGFRSGVLDIWESKVFLWFRDLGTKILNAIPSLAYTLWDVGWDIMWGLAEGIYAGASSLVSAAIGSVANMLPDWIKGPLGINSPSRVFMAIGREIPAGLAIGIGQGTDGVERAMRGLVGATSISGGADGLHAGRGGQFVQIVTLEPGRWAEFLAKAENGDSFARGFASELGMSEGMA